MPSNILYIPEDKLDQEINKYLDVSNSVTIAVSFVFMGGLRLIMDGLRKIAREKHLTLVTSNYLKCTEPAALEAMLELQQLGADIYLYDSIESGNSFHMKSYLFENKSSSSLIVGSSNVSFTAFKEGHELNLLTDNLETCKKFKSIIDRLVADKHTIKLSQTLIDSYKKIYKDEENLFSDKVSYGSISPNLVQSDALEILKTERGLGLNKGLIVLATGMGKTLLSAMDVKQFRAKKVLFVAHREEILNQSMVAYKKVIPNKSYGFYRADTKDLNSDCIFASIQTLGKQENLRAFNPDHFDYIVVDEFHHVGAKSYKDLVSYFKPKFFLGLTATPNRSDNVDILQYCGNNEIYRKDLIDGIDLGLLCNFEYHGINDKYVDYTKITWKNKKFDSIELDSSLNSDARIQYIFEKWQSLKQTRTLAFCSSIRQCERMSQYFSDKGYKSLSVHSQSYINREECINLLRQGKVDILFTVDLFNEGTDIPEVDTLLMARPTESKIIFIQQLGRGLRLAADKSFVRVIDFIGNHKSFLDKPAALFGFEPTNKNIKDFLEKYRHGKLDLPQNSRMLYDLESVEFMDELSKIKVDYDAFYEEFKSANGSRPSASDFYQFIGKLTEVRLRHGSWFDFVNNMGDLSDTERECFVCYKPFFRDFLEKTNMTLCFKMVTLKVMLENKFKPMAITELSLAAFDYLRGSIGLWNEVKSEMKFKNLDDPVNFNKWLKYWQSNSIRALTETRPVFNLTDGIFSLNFDIAESLRDEFISLSEELINFRLLSYIVRSDNSYILRGDPNLPFGSQLHKAFDKKDTPLLFGWDKFDQMTGFWHTDSSKHQAIFITLVKSGFQIEHRYHDYFINEKVFHWQSKRATSQISKGAQVLQSKDKITHLFVRKTDTMFQSGTKVAAPFTYCGVLKNILTITGNNPIQVEFELEYELPDRLRQEFLRI